MGKRKEEENRILAEMEEAMKAEKEEKTQETPMKKSRYFGIIEDETPEKVHCRKCKTLMENGVCPNCGFHIYTPMDEGTKKKIRWIVGGVCLAVFAVLFLWAQFA